MSEYITIMVINNKTSGEFAYQREACGEPDLIAQSKLRRSWKTVRLSLF